MVVPIDLKVGGHGHNVLVERVNGAICLLVTHEKCIGVGFSPDCKAVSTLRCRQPGPAMLFTTEEPNGVKQLSTSDAAKRDSAISQFTACTMIGTAHLKSQSTGWAWLEGPVKRGRGSPYAMLGHELHSNTFDIKVVKDFVNEHNMQPVVVDQGTFGAISPKTTVFYASPNLLPHLEAVIGAAQLEAPTGADVVGFTEDGKSKAQALVRYPEALMARMLHAWLAAAKAARPRARPETAPPSDNAKTAVSTQSETVHALPAAVSAQPAAQIVSPVTPAAARLRAITTSDVPISSLAGLLKKLDAVAPLATDEAGVAICVAHPTPVDESGGVEAEEQRPPWATEISPEQAQQQLNKLEVQAKAGDEEAGSHLASRGPTLRSISNPSGPTATKIARAHREAAQFATGYPVGTRIAVQWHVGKDKEWFDGKVAAHYEWRGKAGNNVIPQGQVTVEYDAGDTVTSRITGIRIRKLNPTEAGDETAVV